MQPPLPPDGKTLLQVELVFPEIALQAQSITQQFLPEFEQIHSGVKVFFPDTGSAALARRDWGETPFKVTDLGSSRTAVEDKIAPEDQLFLLINPAAVEVAQVEKLYIASAGRPVILLNPRLEDVATIGIGYAGRQLRDRFLSKIECCYYIRPLDTAALFRCYPRPGKVVEKKHDTKIISETPKTCGDDLEGF